MLIYMPMIPEAVEAMLATVRLGGIHAVVFGGKLSLVKIIFIRPEEFCFFRQLTIFYVIFIFLLNLFSNLFYLPAGLGLTLEVQPGAICV